MAVNQTRLRNLEESMAYVQKRLTVLDCLEEFLKSGGICAAPTGKKVIEASSEKGVEDSQAASKPVLVYDDGSLFTGAPSRSKPDSVTALNPMVGDAGENSSQGSQQETALPRKKTDPLTRTVEMEIPVLDENVGDWRFHIEQHLEMGGYTEEEKLHMGCAWKNAKVCQVFDKMTKRKKKRKRLKKTSPRHNRIKHKHERSRNKVKMRRNSGNQLCLSQKLYGRCSKVVWMTNKQRCDNACQLLGKMILGEKRVTKKRKKKKVFVKAKRPKYKSGTISCLTLQDKRKCKRSKNRVRPLVFVNQLGKIIKVKEQLMRKKTKSTTWVVKKTGQRQGISQVWLLSVMADKKKCGQLKFKVLRIPKKKFDNQEGEAVRRY